MSNGTGYVFQLSVKFASTGALLNVTGADATEFGANLRHAKALAAEIVDTEAAFHSSPVFPKADARAVPPPEPSVNEAPGVAQVHAIFTSPAGGNESQRIISEISSRPGPKAGMTKTFVRFSDGAEASTISDKLANQLGALKGQRVYVELEETKWGTNLKGVRAV